MAVVTQWFPEIQNIVPGAVKIFVGNKIDLRESLSKTTTDPKLAPIARDTAKTLIESQLKCMYLECSALTREGLREVFEESVKAVLRKKGVRNEKSLSKDEGSNCNCQLI